jgi:hypothetical protein
VSARILAEDDNASRVELDDEGCGIGVAALLISVTSGLPPIERTAFGFGLTPERAFAIADALIDWAEPQGDAEHADHFIWSDPGADPYAQWMLAFFRLPALAQARWARFMSDRRLFCTFEEKRFRVIGASRLGDVWLASDFAREAGYDKRVSVRDCSAWGAEP